VELEVAVAQYNALTDPPPSQGGARGG